MGRARGIDGEGDLGLCEETGGDTRLERNASSEDTELGHRVGSKSESLVAIWTLFAGLEDRVDQEQGVGSVLDDVIEVDIQSRAKVLHVQPLKEG